MIGKINDLYAHKITNPNALNAQMKVLVSPTEGWNGYVMRVLEIDAFGYTPKHQHPWPHINYIIEGEGELQIGDEVTKVSAGSYAFVPGNTIHQFKNISEAVFKFICIVPEEGHII